MSKKIKLQSLHFLFRIFSFLADKTGGWKLFVKPKLIIGSLILGLGITACNTNKNDNSNTQKNNSSKSSNNIESFTECYAPIAENKLDTAEKNIRIKKSRDIKKTDIGSNTDSNDSLISSLKPDKINMKIDTLDNFEIIYTCYKTIEYELDEIYQVVEQMPEFPGGIEKLFKFLSDSLRYGNQVEMCYTQIQGRVICRFVVEKDGSIGQIEVVRGLEPSMDKEAIRVIRSMPNWIPGKQNGKVVRVWFTLPINFKIQY